MDRLTARAANGAAYLINIKPNEQEVESPYPNTLRCIMDSFNRLADYEDAEQRGRLFTMPCDVGDIIYSCQYGVNVFARKVSGFEIGRKTIWIRHAGGKIDISQFGKTVFLDKEQAEAVLAAKEA